MPGDGRIAFEEYSRPLPVWRRGRGCGGRNHPSPRRRSVRSTAATGAAVASVSRFSASSATSGTPRRQSLHEGSGLDVLHAPRGGRTRITRVSRRGGVCIGLGCRRDHARSDTVVPLLPREPRFLLLVRRNVAARVRELIEHLRATIHGSLALVGLRRESQ